MNSWCCRWSVPCCHFLRFSSPGFCWSSTGTAQGTSRRDALHQLPAGCSNIPSRAESWLPCPTMIFSTSFLGWRSCYHGAPASSKAFCFPCQVEQCRSKPRESCHLPTIWPCFPLGKGNKGPRVQCIVSIRKGVEREPNQATLSEKVRWGLFEYFCQETTQKKEVWEVEKGSRQEPGFCT